MSPGPLPGFRPGPAAPAADIAALSQQIATLTAQLAALRAEVQGQCVHQALNGDLTFPANPQKIRAGVIGNSITLDAGGCRIDGVVLSLNAAAQVSISAANLRVDTPVANFAGMVQCTTITATTVVGASYTPGAGNVW